MRIPMNNDNPLTLWGCIVYVLALLLLYTCIAGNREATGAPAERPAGGTGGCES
jgi:hypothetical protein